MPRPDLAEYGRCDLYEVIVIDNASTDGTADFFADVGRFPKPVQYQRNSTNLGFAAGNNQGARLSQGRQLMFLNNDTLVQPGWLGEMLRVSRSSRSVGVVGIKQLFPYTNTIYHTGIVFTPDGRPEHLYPHLDASLPHVNKEREYQAVTGACLLIERSLFDECGGFDEAYRNGYEDIDLCAKVRQRGRTIVCCTGAYIYHYGQISEGRTADDDANAALFASRWGGTLRSDRDEYLIRDRADSGRASQQSVSGIRTLAGDCIYLADELDDGSALTWINAELALALQDRGAAGLCQRRCASLAHVVATGSTASGALECQGCADRRCAAEMVALPAASLEPRSRRRCQSRVLCHQLPVREAGR